MFVLRVKAHFLPWHTGKCKTPHGHRWEVEVTIEARSLNEDGIIVDFGVIKELLPDHKFLNEAEYLRRLTLDFPDYADELEHVARQVGDWIKNPTAERIADRLYDRVMHLLEAGGVDYQSLSVRVWESPGCSVERVNR